METLETVIRKRIHIHAPDGEAVFHLRAEPSGASLFLSGMNTELTYSYDTFEWSPDQMAFNFSMPGDKKVDGWDVVIENIPFYTATEFIVFLNENWKERQKLPASEIRKMFDAWVLTKEGNRNG